MMLHHLLADPQLDILIRIVSELFTSNILFEACDQMAIILVDRDESMSFWLISRRSRPRNCANAHR
jgi:hypothetical protein